MNKRVWILQVICAVAITATGSASAQTKPATNAPAPGGARPTIQFESPVYDFGKVSAGENIKHTFFFTNTGTAKLVLTNVQPSCGCTTAGQWSREVDPGNTGSIPIQFHGGSYEGPQAKSITVTCNDPEHPIVYLQIKGLIWKPISVSPPYAILNITPGMTSTSAKVTITNNMDTPVEVWDPQVSNPAFHVTLATNTPGKGYELSITTVGALKTGSVQGSVTVKTSATNYPTVAVTTWANVQPAISVVPPVINLQQGPLPNRMTPIVTVINNTSNPLVLSEAMVNVPEVEVKVNTVQTNRYFTVMLGFPAGFEAPAGKPMELSMKSNNTNFPVLKVPIHQLPRPVQVTAPPPSIAAPPSSAPVSTPPSSLGQLPTSGVRHVLPRAATPVPPVPSRAVQ